MSALSKVQMSAVTYSGDGDRRFRFIVTGSTDPSKEALWDPTPEIPIPGKRCSQVRPSAQIVRDLLIPRHLCTKRFVRCGQKNGPHRLHDATLTAADSGPDSHQASGAISDYRRAAGLDL